MRREVDTQQILSAVLSLVVPDVVFPVEGDTPLDAIGVDSLRLKRLVAFVEQELMHGIPDEEIGLLRTVDDVHALIVRAIHPDN